MIENNTINYTKNTNELYKDKLIKIKKELEEISPSHIIKDAIQCAEKNRDEKASTYKKNAFLQLTKSHAVQRFLENIKGKSVIDTIAEFNKKTDEYNADMQVILNKTQKENNQYKMQYQSVLDQNIFLREEKKLLSLEYNKLENKLHNSETEINKLQARFALFKNFKELFDVLFNEFPNLSPIEIMEDIKVRKREGAIIVTDYNNALEMIEGLKNQLAEQTSKTRQQVESLTKRAYQIEENYKEKINKYETTIIQLNNDLSQYKHHMEENQKINNSLYSIYNLLIETLSLNREIKVNEALDIKEEDFRVDMLNKEEIIRYVKIMIKSFHFSSSDKLLRETIAYANMMVRTFMQDKINKRFSPVEVFTEIKRLLETKHDRNLQLKQDCIGLKETISNLEKKNKKLLSIIETLRKQVESLQLYAKRTDRQHLALSSNILSPSTKANIICMNKSKQKTTRMTTTEMKCDTKGNDSKEMLINSGTALKKKIKKNKAKKKQQSITSSTSPKRRSVYSYTLNKKNMEKYVLPIYGELTKKASSNEVKSNPDDFVYLEESFESSTEKNVLNRSEEEHFKNIKTAPNKDKLLKTHGFQSFITNLNGFKDLVNHTNRIFFYKAKMIQGKQVSKLDNLNRNIEKRFIDYSSNGFDNPPYYNTDNKLEHHFKSRILNNINTMINSMETEK